MFIRDLNECEEFRAGDNSILRELLHPDKAEIAINYSLAHAIYIPPDSLQFIQNTGTNDLVFLCIVDPAWKKENETIYDIPD